MARLIRCIEGHVYDADQFSACPRCAPAGETDSGASDANAAATEANATVTEATPAVAAAPTAQGGMRRPVLAAALVFVLGAAGTGYWTFHRPQPISAPKHPRPLATPSPPATPPVAVTTAKPVATVAAAKPAPAAPTGIPSAKPHPAATSRQATLAHPAPPAPAQPPPAPNISNNPAVRELDRVLSEPNPGVPAGPAPQYPAGPTKQASLEQPRPPQPVPPRPEIFDGASARKLLADLQQGGAIGSGIVSMARYALGAGFVDHGQSQIGLPFVEQAANDGVAGAAAALAHGYMTGSFGLPKDPQKARPWAQFAAARGEPKANYDLAALEFGDGNAAGKSAARSHFLAAYLASYPAAMDLVHKARQGDARAANTFRALGLNPLRLPPTVPFLYATEGRKNPTAARKQFAAYARNVAVASYFLGIMAWNGQGGVRDRRAAVSLLFNAAEAGYPSGMIYVSAGLLDGSMGRTLPYSAAALLAVAQMSSEPPVTSGLSLITLYSQAQQRMSPRERVIIGELETALRRFAKPGSVFASRKN